MEAAAALLRIAARVAGATASLVARIGDEAPVAAWGCGGAAAQALVRVARRAAPSGAWSFRALPLTLADGAAAELILVAPAADADEAALTALAAEIGAVCDPAGRVAEAAIPVEPFAEGTEQLDETFRDVSARKQFENALAAEKRKLLTTLAAIADAVVSVLADGRVEFINAAAQRLLGVEAADARGMAVAEVIRMVDDDARPIDVVAEQRGEDVRRGTGHLRTAHGIIDVAYVASRVDAETQGTVLVLRDVTIENRIALRLSFEATHDPLTGLQNRRAFTERLDEAVRGARERGEHHAVGFIDLDRFKIVNDRFGHAVGDRLLHEIARVMGRVVRGGDVLARIGGDEFALLLSNCRLDDARRVAEKLRAAVDDYRIRHGGEVLDVGVSVGLAAIEANTTSGADALAEADAACYQAKAAGRNLIVG
jgi:diguanylate cyclase (GGDEF)-like protein/PAS domain S-box-containing protein